ncbi:MAG: RDD family protein [Clostridiales bacterium]|nr:RDD family protein [Clostridiales bacterium]
MGEINIENRERPHPWRRFLAFCFDVAYMAVITNIIWLFVLNHYPSDDWFWGRNGYIILCFATAFIEPLLTMSWVSTAGKSLFGIRILHKSGRKLTYKEGLIRSFKRLKYGLGFMIPFYRIYRLYKSYKKCAAGEELEWDTNVRYVMPEKTRTFKYVFFATVIALIYFLSEYQGLLPKNRGDLTVDEFVENYNSAAEYFGYGYQTMNIDGTIHIDERVSDFYPEPPVFEFETDGEKIKSVSFKYSGNWHEIMKNEGYDYLVIHSLLGARINCFEYSKLDELTEYFTKPTFSDLLEEYKGVHIEKYTDFYDEIQIGVLGDAIDEYEENAADFVVSFNIWL